MYRSRWLLLCGKDRRSKDMGVLIEGVWRDEELPREVGLDALARHGYFVRRRRNAE